MQVGFYQVNGFLFTNAQFTLWVACFPSNRTSWDISRVAEVVRGHVGPRQKVWTRTKILSPNIRYFVGILRFVEITQFLEISGQKKSTFLGQKQFSLDKKCSIT